MGRKGAKNKGPNAASRSQPQISMTLREESTRKKQGNVNARTMSRLEYLKALAQWASFEAAIPSFGALYGERLASFYEALGIPPDPSLFFCERCESILEPAAADVEGPSTFSLGTPVQNMGSSLLESMGKKSRSRAEKVSQTESNSADANADNSISGSKKKRKRKSWTSLKDIAESSMNVKNSAISFI